MSDTLYRRTASGTEAFYPATTAERVACGDTTLEAAMGALSERVEALEENGGGAGTGVETMNDADFLNLLT